MLFYIILFFIIVGLLLCTKSRKISKVPFFVLWIVYGFRNNVGVDDGNYIKIFDYIQRGWGYDVEWSYRALCKLALSMGFNYKFIFIVYGLLSIVLLYKAVDIFYEKNTDKAIYMACYLGLVLVSSVSVMRQFLAACFCFYATAVIYKENNIYKSIGYCIVGSFFHMGAVIAIPFMLLLMPQIKITYSFKILILLICVSCGFLNVANLILNLTMKFLPKSFQIYADEITGSFSSAGGPLSLLLLLLFLIQSFISLGKGKTEPVETKDIYIEKGQFFYLCLLFFFVYAGVASRLAFTFIPFMATIPITFVKHVKKKQQSVLQMCLIMAMLLLMIMTLRVSQVLRQAFIPYNASFIFWD